MSFSWPFVQVSPVVGLVSSFNFGHVVFCSISFRSFVIEFRFFVFLLASSCENSARASCLVLFLKFTI